MVITPEARLDILYSLVQAGITAAGSAYAYGTIIRDPKVRSGTVEDERRRRANAVGGIAAGVAGVAADAYVIGRSLWNAKGVVTSVQGSVYSAALRGSIAVAVGAYFAARAAKDRGGGLGDMATAAAYPLGTYFALRYLTSDRGRNFASSLANLADRFWLKLSADDIHAVWRSMKAEQSFLDFARGAKARGASGVFGLISGLGIALAAGYVAQKTTAQVLGANKVSPYRRNRGGVPRSEVHETAQQRRTRVLFQKTFKSHPGRVVSAQGAGDYVVLELVSGPVNQDQVDRYYSSALNYGYAC